MAQVSWPGGVRVKSLVLSCLVGLMLSLVLVHPAAAQPGDRIVAVVNGEIITMYDLNKNLAPLVERFKDMELGPTDKMRLEEVRRQLLRRMIDDLLLEQEAKRLNLTVTDNDIETHIRRLRSEKNLSEDDFERQLALQNLTPSQYKTLLRKEMLKHRLLNFMVQRKVVVTREEVQKYYESHKSDYSKGGTVKTLLILMPQGSGAADVHRDISSGKLDFAAAARKYSVGPGADQGGDIGSLQWNDLASEWQEALGPLKPGDMSPPFKVNNYDAILLLKERTAGQGQALTEVEDKIRDILLEPKMDQQFQEYMQRLRSKAIIDMKL